MLKIRGPVMKFEEMRVGRFVASIGLQHNPMTQEITEHAAPVQWRTISFDKMTACLAKMGNRPGQTIDWVPIEWLYHSVVEAQEAIWKAGEGLKEGPDDSEKCDLRTPQPQDPGGPDREARD